VSASAKLDAIIVIPEILGQGATGATGGCWTIRHGSAKLRLKYGDTFHSREFDGYAAARAAGDPSWQNRIEMADLLATWLMQSQVERRPGAIEGVLEQRCQIEQELAKVPENLALEQEIPDQTWQQLEALFEAFRVPGVALATMTKILCMKRPALIPMMDSHVMSFLFQSEWPQSGGRNVNGYAAAGIAGMKQFRDLMLHGKNRSALATIRDELTPWLAGLDVSSRAAPAPSQVRVLDSLLWFDGIGHAYFGSLEEGLSVKALSAKLKDADFAVRWRAARALGESGPKAKEAGPALLRVLKDKGEDSLVRSWASHALKAVDPKAAAKAGVT
jgi:Family of unknown function (DUF6308)/HEAT repeats